MVQAIFNSGTLRIKDTSENEEGIIELINADNSRTYGIFNMNSAILEINSGTIISTTTSTTNGGAYAIYINSIGSTIIINGGNLKGMKNGIFVPKGMAINNSGDIQSGKVNLPAGKHIAYKVEDKYVVNYLADGNIVATLEQNGEITNYASIQDAIYAVVADGTLAKITMHESESLGRTIEILEGQNVEIDLNGKEIYIKLATGQLIKSNGDLVIKDSSNGVGKIIAIGNSANGQVLYNAGTGKFEVNEIKIIVEAAGTFSTIYNASSGTIQINGAIINSDLKGGGGRLIRNVSSGTIQINSGDFISQRSIENSSTGTIEINGGNIEFTGSVIENTSTGNVIINGGEINTSDTVAINNTNTGNITINGGNISTTNNGGKVVSNNRAGTVEVYSGILAAYGSNGIGIYNGAKGKIIIGIDDGITKNEPVIMARQTINQAILGGEVYYYDGILKSTDAIVVYPSTTKFKANETPTEAYYLIITTDDAFLKYDREENYYTISYTDIANYELSYTSGSENIVQRYHSLKAAVKDVPENIKSKITVLKDTIENLYVEVTAKQNIVLDLNGKKIIFKDSSTGNSYYQGIHNSGILQIIDSSDKGAGVIEAYRKNGNAVVISQYCTGGTLILGEDDGIVSDTKPVLISENNCGIDNIGSTVKMYDGKIIGTAPISNNQNSIVIIPEGYKYITKAIEGSTRKTGYLVKKVGITIVPETAEWINEGINIKICYTDRKLINQYKINDNEWQNATKYDSATTLIIEDISIQENCTVYARTLNTSDEIVYEEEYQITNIDKIAPTIENVSITTGSATSQTITATGISDNLDGSGLKAYIVTMDVEKPKENAAWIESTDNSITAEVTKNGTWYIYAKDNCRKYIRRKEHKCRKHRYRFTYSNKH